MAGREELRVGRGYTRYWVIELRYEWGVIITGVFDGSEPLDLVICEPGAEDTAIELAGSTVEWAEVTRDSQGHILTATPGSGGGATGTILLKIDDSDTTDMEAGPRGLSIGVTTGGERVEGYKNTLRVGARPLP